MVRGAFLGGYFGVVAAALAVTTGGCTSTRHTSRPPGGIATANLSQVGPWAGGMGIERYERLGTRTKIITTGAEFDFDAASATIEVYQRVGSWRHLATVFLPESVGRLIGTKPIRDQVDYVWVGTDSQASDATLKVMVSGDSVLRFENVRNLGVKLAFAPESLRTKESVGGILALDRLGGLAVVPASAARSDHYRKGFDVETRTWSLTATEPLSLLMLGVCPPRHFDWKRANVPVVHYSSHVRRYPNEGEIASYGTFAKVLEFHSWVWKSHYDPTQLVDGRPGPLWNDDSYKTDANGRWVPEDDAEFRRVIKTAHAAHLLVVPYVHLEGNLGTHMMELRRLKQEYEIDGLYIDGLWQDEPEVAYVAARQIRELFGERGWLTLHDTNNGYFSPFVHAWMDLIVTGEHHDDMDRWSVTSYNISNAAASVWPEIPLGVNDARPMLKEMIDKSLDYNNRFLLMAGTAGQWRDWRLYFTEAEMEFVREYYPARLREMMRARGRY